MRLLEEAAFAFEESTITQESVTFKVGPSVTAYTDLFRSSLMALISIFRRPIVYIARACVAPIQTTLLTGLCLE